MAIIFTSAYVPLAHGTPNWDTQLRTDITNLGGLFNGAIQLANGTDLNGYNFAGQYTGYQLVNTPGSYTDTFLIHVLAPTNGGYAIQTAHRMISGPPQSWRRSYINGVGWSGWSAFFATF